LCISALNLYIFLFNFQIKNPVDTANFDNYPEEEDEPPPDDVTGWDREF